MQAQLPQDLLVLISGICAYIALNGKRDFTDVVKESRDGEIIQDKTSGPDVIT